MPTYSSPTYSSPTYSFDSVPRGLQVIPPRLAGDAEVVGVGDDLSPNTLLWAYRHGIFPWPMDGYPLLWFCPPQRAVLDFDKIYVSERLARARRRCGLTCTLDTAFDAVIARCRHSPRPGQAGTWITPAVEAAYRRLHRLGYAHSAEVWNGAGDLVGGLYGVSAGGAFCGESMFHSASNASKFALLFLCEHLASRGASWLDIQVMTPHLAALGATEILRGEFLDRLEQEQSRGLTLF